jgi:hypothetical protein
VTLLRRAAEAGLFEEADRAVKLKSDPEFQSLRGSPGFEQFLKDLGIEK